MRFPRCLLTAVLAFAAASPGAAATARPDIVFIMADDLGWADVGFNGGNAPTPHLDRLAREGVRLTQHYVAPLCTPTRAALLTGRYWSRFGVTQPQNNRVLPFDTVTLPRALQTLGYATALTGKWHLGSAAADGPNKFGFDHAYGSLAGGVGPWDHRYKEGEYSHTWHRNGERLDESGHVTDLIANEAIRWLGRQPAATPVFLYAAFTAVHLPVKEPAEWVERVPPTITGDVARHYAASIMHLDDAVGRILSALERTGRRERTLVVFTSDNGGSQAENDGQPYPKDNYPQGRVTGSNHPLRGNKGDLHEGGIRVPTVVSWPGRLAAREVASPTHITDWMPTIAAFAGFKGGDELRWDGINLWPQVADGASAAPRAFYWMGPGGNSRAVRDGKWKLIERRAGGEQVVELFDLEADPLEQRDLAGADPQRVAALRTRMTELARSDGDARVKR